MSITTYYKVVCNCGHEGKIKLRENDTPYSGGFWEHYSLEDLNGHAYNSETNSNWQTILKYMRPICPECNTPITPENIKG